LESIISETDEILISDFGSTDGTLEVLEEYVSKYPTRVIYAIHQGWQFSDRINWFFQNAHGKYVRIIGGHDMVFNGSTKSMMTLLENDPDTVMVYSKYCIYLNQDYTLNSFNFISVEDSTPLTSDSPFIRTQSTVNHFYLPSMYYGLYKKDILSDVINFLSSIFANEIITDTGIIAAMLKRGKLICDETSFFFWMKPRPDTDIVSEYRRMSRTNSHGSTSSPFYWSFATICDCYAVIKDMQTLQNMPDNFNQTCLEIFIKMYSSLFYLLPEKITPSDIPPVNFEYLSTTDEVFHTITEYLKKQAKLRLLFQCFNIIKKLIKYTLPYGLVRLIQRIKKGVFRSCHN
jgi:glycosyltransferase involved in cell wall biosynthesis